MRKNRQTAKYHIKSYIIAGSLAGAISMALVLPVPVMAAQQSLASVTGQAQIQPMGDGSGKYMMKSDGFYCLDVNGAGSTQAEIHYFQDYEIDGTVFDGYYYHDTDGKFKACSPHMEHLKGVAVFGDKTDEEADTQNAQEAEKFDGYYFVNNLGRLSAAPQVRYIDNLAIDGITLNGYYYFDENGRLVTEPGIHSLEMDCYEMNFDGSYYFGGTNGALLQKSTVTDDGFIVDDTGKIVNMDDLGMDNLKPQLEKMLSGYQGTWSVYVKDLNEEKEILINDTSLYSASLIKAFVMAKTYEDMEQVKADEAKKLNTADTKTVDVKLNDLLWNMITVSDNESCNELVKLQTDSLDFKKGAEDINKYLEKEGYTVVIAPDGMRGVEQFRTVHPSLVLLDVMLPGLDGWGVCRAIRAESQTPIIMLTAKSETEDKVNGLKQGADDYITKPFEMKEVLARIEAVLRRSGIEPEKSRRRLEFDKLVIDMDAFELTVDGKKVPTPPKEMELLYHLASTPNRVYTRNQLLDEVWGFDYFGDTRTVDVHIKRLREKLEGVSDQWDLKTVWSVGYKFEVK